MAITLNSIFGDLFGHPIWVKSYTQEDGVEIEDGTITFVWQGGGTIDVFTQYNSNEPIVQGEDDFIGVTPANERGQGFDWPVMTAALFEEHCIRWLQYKELLQPNCPECGSVLTLEDDHPHCCNCPKAYYWDRYKELTEMVWSPSELQWICDEGYTNSECAHPLQKGVDVIRLGVDSEGNPHTYVTSLCNYHYQQEVMHSWVVNLGKEPKVSVQHRDDVDCACCRERETDALFYVWPEYTRFADRTNRTGIAQMRYEDSEIGKQYNALELALLTGTVQDVAEVLAPWTWAATDWYPAENKK